MSEPIAYHGSPNLFDEFSYRYIRTNGTQEGVGFYFTDKKHIAEGYAKDGYLYTVAFTGKKALSHTSLTITKNQLTIFLNALHGKTDYLSNWGEVTYEGSDVLKRAVDGEYDTSDNDVDLIAGIVNASGDVYATLYLLEKMFGYDCILPDAEWGGDQKIYVALTVNAFDIIHKEPFTKN